MEKERRIKTISLIALIVAVVGLTVAFASLSTTLTINGSANVDSAEWDVHFISLEDAAKEEGMSFEDCVAELGENICKGFIEIKGTGTFNNYPTVSKYEISNLNLSVSKPGDKVSYLAWINNKGEIDATAKIKVNNMDIKSGDNIALNICSQENAPVASCDWDNDGIVSGLDVSKIATNISLYYSYEDPREVRLSAGHSADIVITLEYTGRLCATFNNDKISCSDIEATELPKRNLEFNNLNIEINAVQK